MDQQPDLFIWKSYQIVLRKHKILQELVQHLICIYSLSKRMTQVFWLFGFLGFLKFHLCWSYLLRCPWSFLLILPPFAPGAESEAKLIKSVLSVLSSSSTKESQKIWDGRFEEGEERISVFYNKFEWIFQIYSLKNGENNVFGKEKCIFSGKQRLWETEKGLNNCGSEYGRFKR